MCMMGKAWEREQDQEQEGIEVEVCRVRRCGQNQVSAFRNLLETGYET